MYEVCEGGEVMNNKRCQICWTGTARGEFMGIPMCLECLSHRFEIDKLDEFNKLVKEHGAPDDFHFFEKVMGNIPKLKPESEWQWWQGVARSRAYEILDTAVQEIEQLRRSEHDTKEKFRWTLEHMMNTHRALLRLRIGFARLSMDVFNNKGIIKDANFWDRVRHTFMRRLDKFNKGWK